MNKYSVDYIQVLFVYVSWQEAKEKEYSIVHHTLDGCDGQTTVHQMLNPFPYELSLSANSQNWISYVVKLR